MTRTKTPYLPTYCGRRPPGSVPHLPTYSQAALRTKRKIPVEPSVNRLPAPAAPVSAGVPTAGDSSGMAPFAAKRAVSREAVFLNPPLPTTTTYLPIAGPSGAVKTGPIYLLHRV